MNLTWEQRELKLKHPWTIARGTSEEKNYWFVRLEEDGLVGFGEAAHNVRYGESLELVEEVFLEAKQSGSFDIETDQKAALAALDMARLDLEGKKAGQTLAELLGVEPGPLPLTSVSIGIDEPGRIAEKVAEVSEYPILKVKLGSGDEESVMQSVRSISERPVRVDANEGWDSKEEALKKCEWLADLNVEFVEQPMPAGRLDDMRWLRQRSPLPLVADEDVMTAADVPKLVGAYDGITLKLMKAGSFREILDSIDQARACDLKVMLGCMIESSLGITAMAQLGSLADWLDLDGNLLISNDPYCGVENDCGRLILPGRPGIGVTEAPVEPG